MTVKLATVIIIIILLLFPLHIIHREHISAFGHHLVPSSNTEDMPASFGIIGQNSSTDTYRIQQNITVPEGSSLEFLNTVVEFLQDSVKNYSINVYGELILVNSSITIQNPAVSRVSLNIGSNLSGNGTGLLLENSSLDFDGIFEAYNTSVKVYNSTIESPFGSSNLSSEDLRYSFSNTHIYSMDSSFSGLEVHNQSGEFIAGGLNLNNLPATKSSIFTPSSVWVAKPDALTNIINVSLDYNIGNTTSVSNITFNLFGNDIYTYHIPPHEGPVISVTANFNISIDKTPEYVPVFNSSSNFTVYFDQPGDQIMLENINITFLSNDTVSIIGPDNSGIYLYNSTWLSYNDNFSLNMNPYYAYSDVPNPEKNAIFLQDHSYLYASGMKLSDQPSGTTPPVFVSSGSLAAYFSILMVNQVNQFGDPLQADNNITSSSLSPAILNTTSSLNVKIESMLSDLPQNIFVSQGKAGTRVYDLLDSMQNGTNLPEFMGDYSDDTLGNVHYFSFQPVEYFNFTAWLNMTYTDPYPVLNMTTGNMVAGIGNSVNVSISSMQGSSNLTEIKVMISNRTANAGSWILAPAIVKQGTEFRKTLNISPEAGLHTGLYRITLDTIEDQAFSNKTIWQISSEIVIYSTAGISTTLMDTRETNGSLSLDAEVNGISPYMRGVAPVIFLVRNQNVTLERKNITEYFSGASNQSIQACFNNTENGTELESLVSLPFPSTDHSSSFLRAFRPIEVSSPNNVSLYRVSIIGLGISLMDQWQIYNGTSSYASENGTIILNIPNGTYFFSVHSPSGFNTTENSVTFTVDGSGLNLDILFSLVEYRLGIVEEGLPANTTWEVVIGNLTVETSTGIIQVQLQPGMYLLKFSSRKYYLPDHPQEWVKISNSTTLIVVHYSYTGGIAGIIEGHPEYTFASVVISAFALLYYLDIRRRSFYPCLSCGTTWPRKNRICPGCGKKMNGRNPKTLEENHK
jgi:hypothetical protein